MTREPIYAAIFALVASSPAFITTSRKLRHWSDVGPSEQPALFQAQKRETATQSTGKPTVWHGSLDLYVYVNTAGAVSPGTVLNPLLDAIDAAFERHPARGPQTLGGLVQWCRIEGAIETSEGTLGDIEVAIIPIHFLTL